MQESKSCLRYLDLVNQAFQIQVWFQQISFPLSITHIKIIFSTFSSYASNLLFVTKISFSGPALASQIAVPLLSCENYNIL